MSNESKAERVFPALRFTRRKNGTSTQNGQNRRFCVTRFMTDRIL